jgi:hypothetical protein
MLLRKENPRGTRSVNLGGWLVTEPVSLRVVTRAERNRLILLSAVHNPCSIPKIPNRSRRVDSQRCHGQ